MVGDNLFRGINRGGFVSAEEIVEAMEDMADEAQGKLLARFFKTGKGEYGEGDRFLGLKVPQTRMVVKIVRHNVTLPEIELLLHSEWHEVRLCGLLLLVEEMRDALPKCRKLGDAKRRENIVGFYLKNASMANNWDLVDLSAGEIVGNYLLYPLTDGTMPDRGLLDKLAHSKNLWEQRMAIVATIMLIRHNQYEDTLRIAATLLRHPHDLIHKAVGWMLREVGKRDIEVLRAFLGTYLHDMPRTSLRYAIERMGEAERRKWMGRSC